MQAFDNYTARANHFLGYTLLKLLVFTVYGTCNATSHDKRFVLIIIIIIICCPLYEGYLKVYIWSKPLL
jgi:hypothetical protein